jgi:DNA-binding XRE family transcriptional regulator
MRKESVRLAKKIAAVFPKNSAVSEKMELAKNLRELFNVVYFNIIFREDILLERICKRV